MPAENSTGTSAAGISATADHPAFWSFSNSARARASSAAVGVRPAYFLRSASVGSGTSITFEPAGALKSKREAAGRSNEIDSNAISNAAPDCPAAKAQGAGSG